MMNGQIYEQDYLEWLKKTTLAIQEKRFQEVDWENLLAELEDMGRSEKKSFTNNLMILIAHLLKLKVQYDAPASMSKSWYNYINEHRQRIINDLQEIPSLKSYLTQGIEKAYPLARKLAIKEGKRADKGFRKPQENEYPLECPFSVEELLDEDFYTYY